MLFISKQAQMYFAVPSGIVFGGFMYYLGKFGAFQALPKQNKTQTKEKQQKSLEKPDQKVIINHSFTADAITPVLRNIQLNQKCRIIYSTLHKAPLSVHQFLDLSTIQGDAQRARFFHTDKNIVPQKFAAKNDHYLKTRAYRNFSLNRGHMAAAGNFSSNQELKNSTFSYANVIPQNSDNNGGIWNTFERYCRSLLKDSKCDTIEVISGPIYNSDKLLEGYHDVYKNEQIVLLKNGIVVPPRLYKIIKCNTKDKTYASGFTFYNQKTYDNSKNLASFQSQIEQIEDSTGLVFNFKDILTGKLSQYDKQGLSKKKYDLDKQFFSGLFNNAKDTQQMNEVLRRAYQQKIDLKQQRQLNSVRIQTQAQKLLTSFKQKAQISECQRLLQYLKLHKRLFYLCGDIERCNLISKKLSEEINNQIFICRNVATLQQQQNLSYKGVYDNKRYRYPHYEILMKLFPREKNGAHPDIAPRSSLSQSFVPATANKYKQQNSQ